MRLRLPFLAQLAVVFSLLLPGLALAQSLRFTSMDIGQGDSAVLVAPGGCAVLFDGGPTGSGATIKAYLKSIGVTRVQMAFVSHLHADHLGGLDEVDVGTNAVPIDAVYDNGGTYNSSAYDEYDAHFGNKRHTATTGQSFSLCNQVTLKVIRSGGGNSDENANSVVVKISYGAFDALVGGDLTGSSPDMESGIASAVGEIELYKVHHHGSRTSSNATFLGVIQPIVSFISVGFDNPYGHPTSECLARLANVGSEVWQTEDPAFGTKLGHIGLTSATGASFAVTQGSTSTTYASKGQSVDTQPPTAPGSLVATAVSSSRIDLSWSASTDNVGVLDYDIFRSTDGTNFSVVASTTGTSHSDTGRAASTTYWYRVTANDAANNASAASNTASATTSAPTSPAKVILNEILANEPGSSTTGEFVELVNAGGSSISIAGWTITVGGTVRHTFASGTTLAAGKAIVVYGGASAIPSGLTNAVAASSGGLSLLNSSATVTVKNGSTTIDSFTYGSSLSGTDGVSMNRSPDASATGSFVLHSTLSSLSASGGLRVNGSAF